MVRQLLYTSSSVGGCTDDQLSTILDQSRNNNGLEGVTGLLWSDGLSFVQVLEGSDSSVGEVYSRICGDERHTNLVKILDSSVEDRQFGSWAMAYRRSFETKDEYDQRVVDLLARVAVPLRLSFAVHMRGRVRDAVLCRSPAA